MKVTIGLKPVGESCMKNGIFTQITSLQNTYYQEKAVTFSLEKVGRAYSAQMIS